MMQNIQKLTAALRYASAWADKLEALREHSAQTESSLLSTTSAGPLAELRRILAEAQEFTKSLTAAHSEATDYRLPAPERQKVA